MIDFKHPPEIIKELVDFVNARTEYTGDDINFNYGTAAEFRTICQIKDDNKESKYPLIWLVWDPKDNQQEWSDPCMYSFSPTIFVCCLTNQDDLTDTKYANTIKSVLYPIFDMFIDESDYHPNIQKDAAFTWSVNDHPYWANDASDFPDFLSSIEVKLNKLIIIEV